METYPGLIADTCHSPKTIENVSKAIPILIRWAQNGITTNTYGDIIRELGFVRFSGIGTVLGYIEDVIDSLRKKTGKQIPTLNSLVTGKDGLPSDGFDYVYSKYSSWPLDVKKTFVAGINKKATDYEHWDQVLQLLCLKPSVVTSKKDEEKIRSGKGHGYGEGPQHKALKDYIYSHPESIGLRNIVKEKSKTEYILLSGDKLDVYFEQKDGTRIAVEVKSIISQDDDILRGLYQCVKYKAVLDAEDKTHCLMVKSKSILVIEGILSPSNQQVKDSLGIVVYEGYIKK